MEGLIKKILLIIFDGLADRPVPQLQGKTPLEAAIIPNLNKLAAEGICGLQNAMGDASYPTSEEAHLGVFGYDWVRDLPGRGVLEALGLGVKLKKNELALRVDFGAVDDELRVLDPRAGNISSVKSFCDFIGEQKIGNFVFKLYPGSGHRAVLTVSGPLVSKEISHHSTIVSDTDPHKAAVHRGGNEVLMPKPLDRTAEAKLTAEVLWQYQLHTHKTLNDFVENRVRRRGGLLPANFILTRGAGYLKDIKSFKEKYGLRAACIAGFPLYRGIGRYLGMDLVEAPGTVGLKDENIKEKIDTALRMLTNKYDFVFVHIKGTDVIAEEEGDALEKKEYLETADKSFRKLLNFKGILCVTGDHATPCILKDHTADPVPILVFGGQKDSVKAFNEKSCLRGDLGHMVGKKIMPYLIKEAKNV